MDVTVLSALHEWNHTALGPWCLACSTQRDVPGAHSCGSASDFPSRFRPSNIPLHVYTTFSLSPVHGGGAALFCYWEQRCYGAQMSRRPWPQSFGVYLGAGLLAPALVLCLIFEKLSSRFQSSRTILHSHQRYSLSLFLVSSGSHPHGRAAVRGH